MTMPRPAGGKFKGQNIKNGSKSFFDKGVWVMIGFESDKVLCTTMLSTCMFFADSLGDEGERDLGSPAPAV